MKTSTKKRLIKFSLILGILMVILGLVAWYKFFREEPEQTFDDANEQFKYGSVGGEADAGIPYWIWLVLPRIFPEHMPRAGGYKAFGLVWEEGQELPVGFTKRTIGFPRVGNNCALCHVGTYRSKLDETPTVVIGAPGHSFRVQEMLRFLVAAANDPRFTASTLLEEIQKETELSYLDKVLYRFVIIPRTKAALIEQGKKLDWMNDNPEWGPGRDDAFNLPKYALANMTVDGSAGACDFNSVWNMKARTGSNKYLNWCGESPSLRSVVIDSALGVGAQPDSEFSDHAKRIEDFMNNLAPPPYPFEINQPLATRGGALYSEHCARCHEPGQALTNTVISLDEIQTDPERERAWSQFAADTFNEVVDDMGFKGREPVIKQTGYLSSPLDGIWMRAPYLHNGSVPNLRELLKIPENRVSKFYRGFDVYDSQDVGFVCKGPDAKREGWLHDTKTRGDGNQGHSYGSELSEDQKSALIEFLKTL
ncbi:MAG: cytochrome c [Planctomycetota bacterium]